MAHTALENTELQHSLPIKYTNQKFDRTTSRTHFTDMLQHAMAKTDFDGTLDHFTEDLVSTRHRLLYGQMNQIHHLATLSLEDQTSPRPNLLYHLTHDAKHMTMTTYNGTLSMPVHTADPLEYTLTHKNYHVRDLPDNLDDKRKIILIRKLIKENLITLD